MRCNNVGLTFFKDGTRISLVCLQIGRITATDPGGPTFEHEKVTKEMRLAETDAEFVDVIHTDAGHYGFIAPIGHVDFYPNRGDKQPGCPPISEDGKQLLNLIKNQ